jgi:2-dehydropantoate 2-reductase
MRILVVGAGAVGGYFGGRLAKAGQDVTFLVRPRRAAALKADGLKIRSTQGDAVLHPQTVTADALHAPFDVILLSVKGYTLASAIADFAPAVGPETLILPLLNGMKHLDALDARFGADRVLGGVCLVVAQLDNDGTIVESGPMQTLRYGERDGVLSERIRALDAVMRTAGFEAVLSTQILRDMWNKWVTLASVGAITCLLRAPIGAVAEADGGPDTALAILEECAAVASACGYPPGEARMAGARRMVAEAGSAMTTSMYRDMMAGHAVEVDQVLGDLVRRGRARGTPTPLLTAAQVALEIYDRARPA